jgi:hypothetical protein
MLRKLSVLVLLALIFTTSSLFCASASQGAGKQRIVIDSAPKISGGSSAVSGTRGFANLSFYALTGLLAEKWLKKRRRT